MLVSMPRCSSNNLYQTRPEIKLLLQKKLQNFRAQGALPPDPQWFPVAGGSVPIPPSTALPFQISVFAPDW